MKLKRLFNLKIVGVLVLLLAAACRTEDGASDMEQSKREKISAFLDFEKSPSFLEARNKKKTSGKSGDASDEPNYAILLPKLSKII